MPNTYNSGRLSLVTGGMKQDQNTLALEGSTKGQRDPRTGGPTWLLRSIVSGNTPDLRVLLTDIPQLF